MNRREAIARVAAMTGTVMFGAEFLLTGCSPRGAEKRAPFTPQDLSLMEEIAETILPATETPGAKAAGVGAFMAMMAQDGYDDATFDVFRKGLTQIDRASRKHHGRKFMESSPSERTAFLTELDRTAWNHSREKSRDEPPHYFRLMKELTLIGFFTSEIGSTQALRYSAIPGAYDGNAPYKKGEPSWVNPTRRFN
jgi:hypothetical protein